MGGIAEYANVSGSARDGWADGRRPYAKHAERLLYPSLYASTDKLSVTINSLDTLVDTSYPVYYPASW